MDLAALILMCAPMVAPDTMAEVVRVESAGQPWVLHVGGIGAVRSDSQAEATAKALAYIEAGRSVDLGLVQINAKNLEPLGLTVSQALDPCTNLNAGGRLLADAYDRAEARFGPGRDALVAALSAYNTGHFAAGVRNGYVARYGLAAPYRPASSWSADPYTADTAVDFTLTTEGSPWSSTP